MNVPKYKSQPNRKEPTSKEPTSLCSVGFNSGPGIRHCIPDCDKKKYTADWMFEGYLDWSNFDSYQCWADIVSTWHLVQFKEMLSKYSIPDSPTETNGEEAIGGSPLPWQLLGSTWPLTNLAATTIFASWTKCLRVWTSPLRLAAGSNCSQGTKASNRLGGRLGLDG